jgi:hypothetical protein
LIGVAGAVRGFPSASKYGFQYVVEARIFSVAGVKLDEARSAFGIEEKLQRVLGGGFGGGERVKGGAGVDLEILAIARVFGRAGRNDFQQRFW